MDVKIRLSGWEKSMG